MKSCNTSTCKQEPVDLANQIEAEITGSLDKVGMESVELPVYVKGQSGGIIQLPANGDFFVSLDDPKAKGIHMSRLYLLAQEYLAESELNFERIESLLKAMVESHAGLSSSSYLKLSFHHLIKRQALVSDKSGWRSYPVSFGGSYNSKTGELSLENTIRITYSSTCPCSAALARQLIQNNFAQSFSESNIDFNEVYTWLGLQSAHSATPHSQRSYADISISFKNAQETLDLLYLIELIEKSLGTAVQTAVKREDEQEFARLNASNLMFSEDSARRIKSALSKEKQILKYQIKVAHVESLHPHDAVVITSSAN